jgi:hypothetical protein
MGVELQVTFDSSDPAAHAAFWAEALHYELQADRAAPTGSERSDTVRTFQP